MLSQITPVLLSYNEERNIGRTLSLLTWAKDIVLVDSGSTDRTLEIAKGFLNVRVFKRRFDTHANQWRYAVQETQITTDWILRLDADYQVGKALLTELSSLQADASINAYYIAFDYAIFSRKLVSSLYPKNTILLRQGCFSIADRGHTEVWNVQGPIAPLSARIMHDDWKSTTQWLNGQAQYMERELEWLSRRKRGLTRWLRLRPPLMPIAMFLYCLFAKGLIINGHAGIYYVLQRTIAEAILSMMLLERELRRRANQSPRSECENYIKQFPADSNR
jgi:glycosyltransferase involved in cell wall biosynthesis